MLRKADTGLELDNQRALSTRWTLGTVTKTAPMIVTKQAPANPVEETSPQGLHQQRLITLPHGERLRKYKQEIECHYQWVEWEVRLCGIGKMKR